MLLKFAGAGLTAIALTTRVFLPQVASPGALATGTPAPTGPPPGWQTVNSFDSLPRACKGFIPREENTWQFVLNFEDTVDQYRGCLKERYEGTKYAYNLVPCTKVGSVNVMTGTAKFEGGYVKCPNFDPRGTLSDADTARHDKFYMWANAKPDVAIGLQNHLVFAHDTSNVKMWVDTRLTLTGNPLTFKSAYAVRSQTNSGTYSMTTRVITSTSDSFHAFYVYQNCTTLPCAIEHKMDEVTYQAYAPVTYTMLSTKPITVFIGGDGVSGGQRFLGEMKEFIIDPQIRPGCC